MRRFWFILGLVVVVSVLVVWVAFRFTGIFMGTLGALLVVLIGWAATWITIIREDEHAVVVEFGDPKRVVSSGLNFVIWPFQYVRRFTTNLIKLDFREAGITTKAGKAEDGNEYGKANIVVKPSMYFRWPGSDRLINTLKVVGNPQDESGLVKLFEETVLDAFRSMGGEQTWRDIAQNRKKFSAAVLADLVADEADPIKQAELQNVILVIAHLRLPDELNAAITKPEVARLEAERMVIEATASRDKTILEAQGAKAKLIAEGEGSKEKIMREGEGYADARKRLFEAIGDSPESLQKETLHTLREMAQGTSNTFIIPTGVTEALKGIGRVMGESDLKSALTSMGIGKAGIDRILKEIEGEAK